MSAAKAKMKKQAELRDKLDALLKRFGTQADLAKELKVDQATVSRWLAGKLPPEGYMKLGNIADPADRLWFWGQAGMDVERLLLAAAEEARSPLYEKIALRLRDLPPNLNLQPFDVEKESGVFSPGDFFLLQPAADPKDPGPFWDRLVLVEFPPRGKGGRGGWLDDAWPEGLFVGQLRCKLSSRSDLSYYATIGARPDPKPSYYFSHDEWPVGEWKHPDPREQPPAEGSLKKAVQQEIEELDAGYISQREKDRGAPYPSPYISKKLKEIGKRQGEARSRLVAIESNELREAEENAKLEAANMVKLYSHADVRIIGGVIAWFAAPKREG